MASISQEGNDPSITTPEQNPSTTSADPKTICEGRELSWKVAKELCEDYGWGSEVCAYIQLELINTQQDQTLLHSLSQIWTSQPLIGALGWLLSIYALSLAIMIASDE